TGSLEAGEARDITARAVGLSWLTYQRAKAGVEAAREDPDLQELVGTMDRTGKGNGVYKRLPLDAQLPEDQAAKVTKGWKRLSYAMVRGRIDHVMQESMVPNLRDLTDAECANLKRLVAFYLTMIDREEERREGSR